MPRMLQPSSSAGTTILLTMLVAACHSAHSASPGTTLAIEAVGPVPVLVQVSSTPSGLWLDSAQSPEPTDQLMALAPAVVRVADSVLTLRVSVRGPGAVRLHFADETAPVGRRGPPGGRDIALRRSVDGRFYPRWQIHPLP